MANAMIERVARALCVQSKTAPIYPQDIDRDWPDFVPYARVAVAAMREPTDAMRLMGVAEYGRSYRAAAPEPTTKVWCAMIDAALAEGQ